MKKIWMLGLIVLVLGLLAAGPAIRALAQGPEDGGTASYGGVYLDQPTLVRLAGALGLTPEELDSRLQEGETLTEIAQAQNVPTEALVEAIIAPHAADLELRVRYGYLTPEQAESLLEAARQRASFLLEQDLSGGQDNYGGHCGYMMGGNWSGMMGGGMMNGQYGPGYGQGGMMGNGWRDSSYSSNQSTGSGWGSAMGRFWSGVTGRGWGGMMGNNSGGGMMGGGMMGGW
ncbi:MAG: hypothetical protein HY530_04405 [Chloroflexi bacterium]|nr:hypothetical protein [Chloroflexota bacterium]